MRRLCLLLPALFISTGLRAAVLMTYFNTEPLLDEDGTTPLQGTLSNGDFIQMLSAGINGVVDPPDEYGGPGGDDALMGILAGVNQTHVGANEPPVNHNLGYFNAAASYDEIQIGLPVYARFWNNALPWTATHYGVTQVFNLPAPDAFNLAFLDLVPTPDSPRIASIPFAGTAPVAVPEPNGLIFLGIAALLLRQQLVSRK